MERRARIAIAALAALYLGVAAFAAGHALGSRSETARSRAVARDGGLGLIEDAYDKILSKSVDPPQPKQLARGAIKGMVGVLKSSEDPYALFYSRKGYEAFQELASGRFSGVGVWLKEKRGKLEIVSVLPKTPALRAGLKRGDVIRRVDDHGAWQMSIDETVARIKGPAGTEVSLGVERDGEVLDFTMTRASLRLPNLQARMRPDEVAYIRLFGFARGAGTQLRSKVEDLLGRGAEGVILDLRDNGGGLFTEAVEVASVFIEDGPIATYRQPSSPDRVSKAKGDAFEDLPVVVLVNEGTASASEIVAGALQDRKRGILVGTKTFGKGSVQEVVNLFDASALKLTTGAYLTPGGKDISGDGIEPDIEVDASASAQKRRALEILRGIVLTDKRPSQG